MGNNKYLWALAVFLAIPVIVVVGGGLAVAIDPEKLAGHTHYVRNFQLLQFAKGAVMLAMLGLVVSAWFIACALLIKAKDRPYWWLSFALLGPLGLAVLVSLPALGVEPSDLYERLTRRLNVYWRIVYEAAFLILAWNVAWEMMIIKREAMIFGQSLMTGVSREQILQEQNASSGMWAFSEFLEVLFAFALLYILRPFIVNVVGAMFKVGRGTELARDRPRP